MLFIACIIFTSCASTTIPSGKFMAENYFTSKLPMVKGTGDGRLTQDLLIEPFLYPFIHVLNFGSLRFLWDHSEYPFSGFANSFLSVIATVPGYSHTDLRFNKIFGLGNTNTEIEYKQEGTPPEEYLKK